MLVETHTHEVKNERAWRYFVQDAFRQLGRDFTVSADEMARLVNLVPWTPRNCQDCISLI